MSTPQFFLAGFFFHPSQITYEWVLVIVGVITCFVIGWQALETRRAAEATRISAEETKTAANAALLNAQAVINSERPWLLIQTNEIKDPFLIPVEAGSRHAAHCIFSIKNWGRTPGIVFSEKVELQISDNPIALPDCKVYNVDWKRDNPLPFPPNESIPVEANLSPIGFITKKDSDGILSKDKFLWLCGFIRYRDTFERAKAPEYETQFCYLWETRQNTAKPFWRMTLVEYNKAT
jgi:hypothetical protein